MAAERVIAFIHGIGGPIPEDAWLLPLNATLAGLRMPAVQAGLDRCIGVDYLRTLQQVRDEEPPPVTWARPEPQRRAESWLDFQQRKQAFADLLTGARKASAQFPLGQVPTALSDPIPHAIPVVRTYLADERARNATWRTVLGQLPSSGSIVVVAHSLGSIVMLDLLTRLPQGLHVDLMLTIGSPLAIGAFRDHLEGLREVADFPVDRLGAWVNAYDPDDLVTVGRGAAKDFEAAIDIPVDTGASHSITAYMSQPVVGASVAIAMFGPTMTASEGTPTQRLHPSWWPLILRFAYLAELWRTWPPDKWQERLRMDAARRILAARVVAEAERQRDRVWAQVEALPEPARSLLAAEVAERPFAPDRVPGQDLLIQHAAEAARGQVAPDVLLLAGVDLVLGLPFAPFGIEVNAERARAALGAMLEQVHRDDDQWSPAAITDAVMLGVEDAKKAMSRRGIPWAPLLLGAGVIVLAGTGIGLAAAIPAGLAGAAAVAATLAAFGPGGMAGGVATLAVLTGTSAALATAGLTIGSADRAQVERLQADLAQEVALMPVPAFRTALVGLLAVQGARRRLELPDHGDALERTLLGVESVVLAECSAHASIAPKAAASKQWQDKADLLERAMAWVARNRQDATAEARVGLARELEQGPTIRELPGSSHR